MLQGTQQTSEASEEYQLATVLGMTSTYGQGDIYNSPVSFGFEPKQIFTYTEDFGIVQSTDTLGSKSCFRLTPALAKGLLSAPLSPSRGWAPVSFLLRLRASAVS